jgi:hypothetical protein
MMLGVDIALLDQTPLNLFIKGYGVEDHDFIGRMWRGKGRPLGKSWLRPRTQRSSVRTRVK